MDAQGQQQCDLGQAAATAQDMGDVLKVTQQGLSPTPTHNESLDRLLHHSHGPVPYTQAIARAGSAYEGPSDSETANPKNAKQTDVAKHTSSPEHRMDRTDVAAQQARLAEYRKQQDQDKQKVEPTSAAKKSDPQGQVGKDQAPMKPEFQKAHDHAKANGEKKEPQVLPQLREQDAAKASPGMNGPKPPQSTGPQASRDAHLEQLRKTNEQAKARQAQADRGNMKDGKDHD